MRTAKGSSYQSGSRSTPLALAFEAHPNIKTWIHPDERSAAFFAVGLIKGGQSCHYMYVRYSSSNYRLQLLKAIH